MLTKALIVDELVTKIDVTSIITAGKACTPVWPLFAVLHEFQGITSLSQSVPIWALS